MATIGVLQNIVAILVRSQSITRMYTTLFVPKNGSISDTTA